MKFHCLLFLIISFNFPSEKPKQRPIYVAPDDVANTYSSVNIYAGVTYSKISGFENESYISNYYDYYNDDLSPISSIRFGIEKDYGNNRIMGIGFSSHGVENRQSYGNFYQDRTDKSEQSIKYLSGYIHYHTPDNFIYGLEFGLVREVENKINSYRQYSYGYAESNSYTYSIDRDEFEDSGGNIFDIGAVLGFKIPFYNEFDLRITYYHGLFSLVENQDIYNRTLYFDLLYPLKSLL